MKNLIIITILLLTQTLTLAQVNLNLRKVIQKSDLIIDIDDYRSDTIWINDFTYKTYLQMDKIDSTNAVIIRNKLSSTPKKLTLRKDTDNEDFYAEDINWECGCMGKTHEQGKLYSDLFFIKKEKNEYKVLMHLYGLEWEQRENYKHQIKSVRGFENIKNEKERFAKTLDWFIENGLTPDSDFIEYYKTKKITTDTIQYSEKQYQNALHQFQNGKEDILPIVRDKYFDEMKKYYVQKMEDILKIEKTEYKDYYAFDKAFSNICGDDLTIDSVDYILNNSLTSDKFEEYDKKRIMEHLLKVAKEWKKSE